MKKLISALISLFVLIVSPSLVLANSVTLYPTADTFVYSGGANNRYNNEADLLVLFDHQTNQVTYPLLKFSLDQIPAGSQVHHVNLVLYQRSGEGLSPVNLAFVTIGGDWNSNVTFNTKPASGGFFTNNVADDRSVGYKTWDLAGQVRQWVERTSPNYGLELLKSDGFNNQSYKRVFASSEDPNPNLRPKLTVEYDLPTPEQAAAAAGQGQGARAGGNVPVNVANPVVSIKPNISIGPIVVNIPAGAAVNLSISEIKSDSITDSSAKITWKTNNSSTSWVFFGDATNGDKVNLQAGQADSVKDHSVNLSSLKANTKYSYKVYSKDANNKDLYGAIAYFTTAQTGQAAVIASPTPDSSNPLANLESTIENKVAEYAINKSLDSSNSASIGTGSTDASPSQTELKGPGLVNLFAGSIGLSKLAGILLIILGLMSLVGLFLLYIVSRKVHHHIRKHLDKKYAKKFNKRR